MNSLEISSILKRDRFTKHFFRGVFACDQLPKQFVPHPSAIVINTDPADKPGEHWLAIYITRDGVGEYFDSYGLRPKLPQIEHFLQKNAKYTIYNTRRLQGPLSTVCGQYVIFFLLHRCRELSMNKINKLFSSDTMDNDMDVNNFIRKHFPRIKTEVYDEQFIIRQISRALLHQVSFTK